MAFLIGLCLQVADPKENQELQAVREEIFHLMLLVESTCSILCNGSISCKKILLFCIRKRVLDSVKYLEKQQGGQVKALCLRPSLQHQPMRDWYISYLSYLRRLVETSGSQES